MAMIQKIRNNSINANKLTPSLRRQLSGVPFTIGIANSTSGEQLDIIDTAQIADDAITTGKIADDAVDSDKIADGAIETIHFADDCENPEYNTIFNPYNGSMHIDRDWISWDGSYLLWNTIGLSIWRSDVSGGQKISSLYTMSAGANIVRYRDNGTTDNVQWTDDGVPMTNGDSLYYYVRNRYATANDYIIVEQNYPYRDYLGENIVLIAFIRSNQLNWRFARPFTTTETGIFTLAKINSFEIDGNLDRHYIHTQSTASTTWTVNHNLGKTPSVIVKNSSGQTVLTEINHISTNQLTIVLSSASSGIAYCN